MTSPNLPRPVVHYHNHVRPHVVRLLLQLARSLPAGRGVCRRLARLAGGSALAEAVWPDGSRFRFRMGDHYWSKLLIPGFIYEPEVLQVLLRAAPLSRMLVDAGANHGYWSVLATSKHVGFGEAVAIEASAANLRMLAVNHELNGGRFEVVHAALGENDGEEVVLAGARHYGLRVQSPGSNVNDGEQVLSVSLDGLRQRFAMARDDGIVVKLDVEGMEIPTLRGGQQLLGGEVLLIYEEDKVNAGGDMVSRFVMQDMGWPIWHVDAAGHAQRLKRLEQLPGLLRQHGTLNLVAANPGSRYAAMMQQWEEGRSSQPNHPSPTNRQTM